MSNNAHSLVTFSGCWMMMFSQWQIKKKQQSCLWWQHWLDCNTANSLLKKVLKALQDAVTNHNLAVQSNPPPPEPTPTNVTSVKNHARQLPVHSFQVNQVEKVTFYLFLSYMTWDKTNHTTDLWLCKCITAVCLCTSRWRWWGMADRRFLWMWTQECCSLTGRLVHLV